MKIRLQKIIAESGLASRRQAEQWISEGRVRVNGHVVDQLGAMADSEVDSIKVGNRRLPPSEAKKYFIFHKPLGCVTTLQDERGRPTIMDYLKKVEIRIFPVGRLDYNTQGVLLLTNDGMLSRKLLDPKFKVPRTYQVKVRGVPDEKNLSRLRKGIPLNNQPTAPIEVRTDRISGKNCFLTLKLIEGKNRHIKRICEKIGHPVIRLKRTHFAFLGLKGLNPGQFRHLNPKEIQSLRQWAEKLEDQRLAKTG